MQLVCDIEALERFSVLIHPPFLGLRVLTGPENEQVFLKFPLFSELDFVIKFQNVGRIKYHLLARLRLMYRYLLGISSRFKTDFESFIFLTLSRNNVIAREPSCPIASSSIAIWDPIGRFGNLNKIPTKL